LPDLLEALAKVGLNTTSACGDVTRNVTGCPVAGVDADEICDASPIALEASRMLAGNGDFYNLPRKFKISIAGCRVWCAVRPRSVSPCGLPEGSPPIHTWECD